MPPASNPDRSAGSAAATGERLRRLLAPAVTQTGYDLEDVSVTPAGRRSLVRVTVDSDAGVDLDAVAEVSRVVSAVLDEQDAVAGSYVLEVSSPGVERPLTEPRHWHRATGRLVRVPVAGQLTTGRVREVTGTGVMLEVDGHAREVGWAELGRGTVQIEFNRQEDEP
jgi:ribosome maturation factor RimP